MTKLPMHTTGTEEVDHEEWLLTIVDCELATLAHAAYEGLIPELDCFADELTKLAIGNQARVKVLTDLREKLIARISKRSPVPYKKAHWLGGNA
jgi:hypothetical protein